MYVDKRRGNCRRSLADAPALAEFWLQVFIGSNSLMFEVRQIAWLSCVRIFRDFERWTSNEAKSKTAYDSIAAVDQLHNRFRGICFDPKGEKLIYVFGETAPAITEGLEFVTVDGGDNEIARVAEVKGHLRDFLAQPGRLFSLGYQLVSGIAVEDPSDN